MADKKPENQWKKLKYLPNSRGGIFTIRHKTTGEFKEFPLEMEEADFNLFNNAWTRILMRRKADAEAKRDAFIEAELEAALKAYEAAEAAKAAGTVE